MIPLPAGSTAAALADLARVALSGDDDGTRQLIRRLIRRPPADIGESVQLKATLTAILADAPKSRSGPLRGQPSIADVAIEDLEFAWVQPPGGMKEPILATELAHSISALVEEHRNPGRLALYGLTASRAVLFTGPPGVGKTLTAGYVASELQLPLITVNIASLMSSLMGKTAQNLQSVIDRAGQQTCVLFLDEFDALAKSRDDLSDIGEVKRLVNVVLQQMDQWPAGSLLIAATNHPQLLDPAVHRRFDATIHFAAPGYAERLRFLRDNDVLLLGGSSDEQLSILALVSENWSLAELDNWINRTARRAILGANDESRAALGLTQALVEGAGRYARDWIAESADRRRQLATLASVHLRWTQRTIAAWLGVSHVTIGKDLARSADSKK
jgi:hypothetical protein